MSENRVPEISQKNGVTIVTLGAAYENLDEWDLDEVRESILDASKLAEPPKIVIELSHVKFFGSSFIEILFRVWNRMNAQENGRFAIAGLTPYCREILEVTHLDELWDLYDSADDAVDGLSS